MMGANGSGGSVAVASGASVAVLAGVAVAELTGALVVGFGGVAVAVAALTGVALARRRDTGLDEAGCVAGREGVEEGRLAAGIDAWRAKRNRPPAATSPRAPSASAATRIRFRRGAGLWGNAPRGRSRGGG